MKNFDWKKWDSTFSFKLDKQSDSVFHFCWKDTASKVYGEADFVIEEAPNFLVKTLENGDQLILICYNIKFCQETYLKELPPEVFIKVISKTLGEFFSLTRKRKLAGVLFLLPEERISCLTELKRHWLKDFNDLFSFIDQTPDGVNRLYMPTTHEVYKHYLELDLLLEKRILDRSIKNIEKTSFLEGEIKET